MVSIFDWLTEPDHYKQGIKEQLSGNFEAAAVEYTKAIQSSPYHFNAYLGRAWVRMYLGDFNGGIEDCNKATQVSLGVSIFKAAAYMNRGVARGQKQNVEEGIDDLSDAISLLKKPSGSIFIKIIGEFLGNKLLLAKAYSSRGITYVQQGNYEAGIADCLKAIQISSSPFWQNKDILAFAYNNLGTAYIENGELNRGLEAHNMAVNIAQTVSIDSSILMYIGRASAYVARNEYDLALNDVETALIRSQSRQAYFLVRSLIMRAIIYNKMLNQDGMVSDFASAIRASNQKKHLLCMIYDERGSIYMTNGDYQRAIEDFTETIRLNPQFSKAYSDRRDAYKALGFMENALADEERFQYATRDPEALDPIVIANPSRLWLKRYGHIIAAIVVLFIGVIAMFIAYLNRLY